MAKKCQKKIKSKPKAQLKKKTNKTRKSRIEKTQEKKELHKFEIKSGLLFEDILSKVIQLKDGRYGVLCENGEFLIFEINEENEMERDMSFQLPGSNQFCQLGNELLVFNGFNTISFWILDGTKMHELEEYNTIFSIVTYCMEPINDDICAICGPNDTIEIAKYDGKKLGITYINYQKSKSKNKKSKINLDSNTGGIGCLYYQKKYNRLLASHFNNVVRVWNCDFNKDKYELFKEVENVTSFAGKVIHEINNKIIIGGKGVITVLNNITYEIIDFIDLGNLNYEIFSMEVIKYYNFKEFVVCGLSNGKILGVDIAKKKVEFNKEKIYNTGKNNELSVKDGKVCFYGENISYIFKVEKKNMILIASHDHTLKLIEY